MLRRWIAVAMLVVATTIGVASATSLGTFEDIVFSGMSQEVTPCTAEVELYDDVGGLLVNLLELDLLSVTSEIDWIMLSGLTEHCANTQPVVVVAGEELISGEEKVVLVLDELPALDGTQSSVDLDFTDDPIALGGLTVDVLRGDLTRVAFCPVEATCT